MTTRNPIERYLAYHGLTAAVDSLEFAGPGNVDDWTPGDDPDYDDMVRDIVRAASSAVHDLAPRYPYPEPRQDPPQSS